MPHIRLNRPGEVIPVNPFDAAIVPEDVPPDNAPAYNYTYEQMPNGQVRVTANPTREVWGQWTTPTWGLTEQELKDIRNITKGKSSYKTFSKEYLK